MKKRGGYALNLTRQIKVRVSQETLDRLVQLSDEKGFTLARLVRSFIAAGLESRQT